MEKFNRLYSLNTLSKDDMNKIPCVDKMVNALKDIYVEAHKEIENSLDKIIRVVLDSSSPELFMERLRDIKIRLIDLLFQCKTTTEIKKVLVIGYVLSIIKNEIQSVGEDIKNEYSNNNEWRVLVTKEYGCAIPVWV